ncbi:40S ribosomal protein S16 [Diplonema papillatum]|nr:40S ribosomal protein S16 [Diplonema papillatum]|eukprot:gene7949-12200_t
MADAQAKTEVKKVQTYGKKKHAIAVVTCQAGKGMIRVNGVPLNNVQPVGLRLKLQEPILLAGASKFRGVDMRIRVRGGGHTSQIFAIRQAMAKSLVAYYQKYVDEPTKMEIKNAYLGFDRTLLIADPRRAEAKKFGGSGARSRYAKSYR